MRKKKTRDVESFNGVEFKQNEADSTAEARVGFSRSQRTRSASVYLTRTCVKGGHLDVRSVQH